MTPNLWHPEWCGRQFCTAYAPEGTIERTYHRSQPVVLPDETDSHLAWYLHRGANPAGDDPYLEIALLETPVAGYWWHPAEPPVAELAISVTQARQLTGAVTALLASQPPRHIRKAS